MGFESLVRIVPALAGVLASCVVAPEAAGTGPWDASDAASADPWPADPGRAGDCFDLSFRVAPTRASAFVVFDQQMNPAPNGDCRCYAPLFGASNVEGAGDRLGRLLRDVEGPRLGVLAVPPLVGPFASKWTFEPACDGARIEIPLGEQQASAVADTLEAMETMAGGDVLVDALELAGDALAAEDTPSKTIVLYTILGDWCGRSDGVSRDDRSAMLATAIADLHARGIETIVTGDVGAYRGGHLDRLAVAGGSGHAYDLDRQEAALGERLRGLGHAACEFDLERSDVDPTALEVTFDARAVPGDGFSVVGQRLEIRGAWCDELHAGTVEELRVRSRCADAPE